MKNPSLTVMCIERDSSSFSILRRSINRTLHLPELRLFFFSSVLPTTNILSRGAQVEFGGYGGGTRCFRRMENSSVKGMGRVYHGGFVLLLLAAALNWTNSEQFLQLRLWFE